MKALHKGFLQGCPDLNKELVAKYLNPSPATAKGHMKRPKKGIRSTGKAATKKGDVVNNVPTPVPQVAPPVLPVFFEPPPYHGPAYSVQHEANFIPKDDLTANVFVLVLSQIRSVVSYIITSPGNSPSCLLTEMSAPLSCITTKPTPSW
jgi:hypothetical protein